MSDNSDFFSYTEATNIKIDDLLLINEYPCKIVERRVSKNWKTRTL